MSDPNIFDELMKLLSQPGSVNWELAKQISNHITGDRQPVDPWVAEEYIEMTRLAQIRVAQASELDTGALVDAIPLDRSEWAERNIRSYAYLVEPIAEKLSSSVAGGGLDAMLKPLAPALLGMQTGMMVGFLAQTVLGNGFVGVPTQERGDVEFVIPNLEAFIQEHNLDPKQTRLWSAVHEVAHHVAMGKAWIRPHLHSLIKDYVEAMEVDASSFGAIEDLNDPQRLQELLSEGGGFPTLLTGPETSATADAIKAILALADGYVVYLVDRSAKELLPDLSAMRTAAGSSLARTPEQPGILTRLLGIEIDDAAARQAAVFCAEVESRWGADSVARIWTDSDNLPQLDELWDATGWAARVLIQDPFSQGD